MSKNHSHFGIYSYIKKEGLILLIKKARGPYEGMYDLPGGSPEEGETNEETLIREVKEETGLTISSYKKLTDQVITTFYKYSLNEENYLLKHSALLYDAQCYTGYLKTNSDGEDSNGAEWIKISELDQSQCTPFVKIILSHLQVL